MFARLCRSPEGAPFPEVERDNEFKSSMAKPATDFPPLEELFLNAPLYEKYQTDNAACASLLKFEGTLDFHCLECGRESTFVGKVPDQQAKVMALILSSPARVAQPQFNVEFTFTCTRNNDHAVHFFFAVRNGTTQKIGQYPSLADLSTPELRKYRPVLGDERYAELNRGVGLAAHGVGIGAFVYLRRVFEWTIEEAHKAASARPGWSEPEYEKSRMADKIALLKDHLPEFLVENRSLYSILSRGVHELTEDECKRAFPTVKIGIELILDDMLTAHEKAKKIEAASKNIAALNSNLAKSRT